MIYFLKRKNFPSPGGLDAKKFLALFLAVLLVYGPYSYGQPENVNIPGPGMMEHFTEALEAYRGGLAEAAAAKLENILRSLTGSEPVLKAKVYLLLGACREEMGQGEKAREYFSRLKEMLDTGIIDRVPAITGIDHPSFPAYQEIFSEDNFFSFNKPVPVSDVIQNKVIHAPRKSVEEKEKEKKKRKFPWLLAIGAVVIAGTAAVLLMSSKKGNKNSVFPEIEWVRIPAGEFIMGDNFAEGDADEQPVHPVYLEEFHISKFEITYSQYDFFCDETGREKPADVFVWGSYDRRGRFPVVSISWEDAAAFCAWLSGRTGEKIYLPTEAQWEKAARGNKQYRYPWGNSEPACSIANYFGCGDYETWFSQLTHVGLHSGGISPYGVHDMAGNAWEWCRDWYGETYYTVAAANNKNPQGPGTGSCRVIRGGGIDSHIIDIRAAARYYHTPAYGRAELGFRIVMEK